MEKCPKCAGTEFIGIEYAYPSPERYDGVSEWQCRQCQTRIGRWSEIVLKEDEIEGRYGTGSPVKCPPPDTE